MRPTWYEQDSGSGGRRRGYPFTGFSTPRSVVGILLVVNIVMFLLQNILSLPLFSSSGQDPLVPILGLHCHKMLGPQVFILFYQFVTYQFLHGGIIHILINMIVLWFFGRELESRLGSRRFLVLYLAGGVFGGMLFMFFSALSGSQIPVIGASGAVFSVVIYFAMVWPERTVNLFLIPFIVPMKVKHMALLFVGLDLFNGLFNTTSGKAHFCHLGGALFGFLYYRYEQRVKIAFHRAKERKRRREEESEADIQAEVDRLLRKIHEKGLSSLTAAEKTFLNETSRRFRQKK